MNGDDYTYDGTLYKSQESPIKNASDGTTVFKFINNIDAKEYGTLKLTKAFADTLVDQSAKFQFKLTIAGQEATKWVGIGEEVSLKDFFPDKNFLAGTPFTLEEVSTGGAVDFTPTFSGTGVTQASGSRSCTGKLQANSTPIEIACTNSLSGGYQLPETGGSGITVYLLIGFALITLPLAVAAKRRKA